MPGGILTHCSMYEGRTAAEAGITFGRSWKAPLFLSGTDIRAQDTRT
jgi:hypothetical protein